MEMYKFSCGCSWPIIRDSAGTIPYINIDVNNLPTCNKVFELISTGHTKGIFQLESNLGKKWAKRLKPTCDEDMSALGAILRPGVLLSKEQDGKSVTEHFCMRKNEEEEITIYHESLRGILENTYGLLTYQEQLMAISARIAGFSKLQVDALRRAVGKKDQQALAKVRNEFYEGCKKLGVVTDEQAQYIWGQIQKSGRYAFNKSINKFTTVKTSENITKTIEELNIGEKITSPEGLTEVKNKYDHGQQHVFEIELENGNKITCTMEHKFMCEDREVRPLWQILHFEDKILCEG